MGDFSAELAARKRQLRQEGLVRRRQQLDKEELSRRILARMVALPEYQNARTIMSYVSMADEVCTKPLLTLAWEKKLRVVVPRCAGSMLQLVAVKGMEELVPGVLGILEPRSELCLQSDRVMEPAALDFVVIPGVVFDRHGGRLGYGKGYYDRLLHQVHADTAEVALAFECQLIEHVPMLEHDVRVKKILTELVSYECVQRSNVLL